VTGTVLVVEDEEDLREMIRDALRMDGFTVVTAQDGREALELLPSLHDCCVILLDLLMPRMDGWSFMEALSADPLFCKLPVIVHSSSPRKAPPKVTRVLQKPVEVERLLSAIHECCDHPLP
jgi:CheY-like chemotaxis protein